MAKLNSPLACFKATCNLSPFLDIVYLFCLSVGAAVVAAPAYFLFPLSNKTLESHRSDP